MMIMTKDNHKEELEDKNIFTDIVNFVDNIYVKIGLKIIFNWLWEKKARLAWSLLISICAICFWFLKVQPKLDEFTLMNSKVNSIQSKTQKTDSLLMVINQKLDNGFTGVHNRFDSVDNRLYNIDSDFGTLIHYVSKKTGDEEYLRREILDDHKNIK